MNRRAFQLALVLLIGLVGCRNDPVAVADPLPKKELLPESGTLPDTGILRADYIPVPGGPLVCDPTLRPGNPLIWGVNGHPVAPAEAYDFRDDPERLRQQMRLIKDLGFTHYRVDVHFDMDGTEPGLLSEVATVAEEFGVTLLPVITVHASLIPQDPTEAREAGRVIATAFVQRYGDRFPVVELGNELDIPAMKGNFVGHVLDHYRMEDLRRFEAFLRGMLGKLQGQVPEVRTIVNASMAHTGFLQYLLDQGVPFDIIGWHVYADELGYGTDVEHGGDYASALVRLEAMGREIWVTESNRNQGSGPGNAFEAEQELWLRRLAAQMHTHPLVKAFFVYELYDEVGQPGDEAYYGLVHCTGAPEIGRGCRGALELKPAYLSALAWRGVRASAGVTP